MSAPASTDALQALWEALRDAFAHYMEVTPPEKRRAAMLGQIRHFLRDNGVTGTRDGGKSLPQAQLADFLKALPFPPSGNS